MLFATVVASAAVQFVGVSLDSSVAGYTLLVVTVFAPLVNTLLNVATMHDTMTAGFIFVRPAALIIRPHKRRLTLQRRTPVFRLR